MNFFSHTSSASCLSKTGLPRVTYLKLDANVQAPWNVVKSQSAQVCSRMDEDCKGSLLDREENEKGHLVQSLCWESEAQLTFHTHTHTHTHRLCFKVQLVALVLPLCFCLVWQNPHGTSPHPYSGTLPQPLPHPRPLSSTFHPVTFKFELAAVGA